LNPVLGLGLLVWFYGLWLMGWQSGVGYRAPFSASLEQITPSPQKGQQKTQWHFFLDP
jgi:hypothetical protein